MGNVDKWLIVILDVLGRTIEVPDLSCYSPCGSRLRFRINKYHAISDLAATVLKPVVSKLAKVYSKRTHLASLDLSYRDSLAMYSLNLNFPESAIIIRTKQKLLSDINLTFKYHTRQDRLTILIKGLCNMELRGVILVLFPLVGCVDRQQIQESQEMIKTLSCCV